VNGGLLALLGLVVYAIAIVGVILVRDRGLAWRFERELGAGDEPRRTLFETLERRLGPVGAPLVRKLQLEDPRRREKLRRRIEAAGRPGGLTVERYADRKGALLVVCGGLALFALLSGTIVSAVALVILGLFALDAWISGTARRRQEAIDRALPDFLDILAVCVSAGIAFRPALSRVSEASEGPVREEMQLVLRQIALGASRRDAFEALRERNTSDGVATFVTAVQQAEELGVPLTDALVDLARDMRQEAFQRARQRAQKATPRVSVVTTAVIAPGAVIIIIASLFATVDLSPLR
jgi:tight adherence protein C